MYTSNTPQIITERQTLEWANSKFINIESTLFTLILSNVLKLKITGLTEGVTYQWATKSQPNLPNNNSITADFFVVDAGATEVDLDISLPRDYFSTGCDYWFGLREVEFPLVEGEPIKLGEEKIQFKFDISQNIVWTTGVEIINRIVGGEWTTSGNPLNQTTNKIVDDNSINRADDTLADDDLIPSNEMVKDYVDNTVSVDLNTKFDKTGGQITDQTYLQKTVANANFPAFILNNSVAGADGTGASVSFSNLLTQPAYPYVLNSNSIGSNFLTRRYSGTSSELIFQINDGSLAWQDALRVRLNETTVTGDLFVGATNVITAINAKQDSLGFTPENIANKGVLNGYASLDGAGKVPTSQLPALAITETFVVNSQASMLALVAQTGDVAIRTDLNKTFILTAEPSNVLGNWQEMLTPTDLVLSVNGQTGVVTLTKNDVGLANVDNTNDLAKPISTATQTALNTKLNIANNLSDLNDTAIARDNLDVYSKAEVNQSVDFEGLINNNVIGYAETFTLNSLTRQPWQTYNAEKELKTLLIDTQTNTVPNSYFSGKSNIPYLNTASTNLVNLGSDNGLINIVNGDVANNIVSDNIVLNGTDEAVVTNTDSVLRAGNLTYIAKFNATNLTGDRVLFAGNGASTPSIRIRNGVIQIIVNGAGTVTLASTNTLLAGNDYILALVKTSADVYTAYSNFSGSMALEGTDTSTLTLVSRKVKIGADVSTSFFQGTIYKFYINNKEALSLNQIQAIANLWV